MDRRDFLKTAAKAAAAAQVGAAVLAKGSEAAVEQKNGRFKKAIVLGMVQGEMSTPDRFKLARDCGFEGIEVPPPMTPEAIADVQKAVHESGIPAHSVIFGGWGKPLSHPDPAIRRQGLEDLKTALKGAKEIGADGLLLVPAVVNKETRYVDAYRRSQEGIRQALDLAASLKVRINIENVWNKFLLSPLEFARYIDELRSPWVRAYFDVGNVIDFGWPEDWIRTLGDRIVKVHLKDFRRDGRKWVPLGEGDADYPEVRRALDQVKYSGWLTCELPAGDEAYLKEVARRVDRIIAGRNPVEA
ncbi:MAG: sugar phosphate isomerase/epimerase family protein [Armatimonadota bacterium]